MTKYKDRKIHADQALLTTNTGGVQDYFRQGSNSHLLHHYCSCFCGLLWWWSPGSFKRRRIRNGRKQVQMGPHAPGDSGAVNEYGVFHHRSFTIVKRNCKAGVWAKAASAFLVTLVVLYVRFKSTLLGISQLWLCSYQCHQPTSTGWKAFH